MECPQIELRVVSKEDVLKIHEWLQDDEVAETWFGRYSYGDSAHLAYNPGKAAYFSEAKWKEVFEDSDHKIFSIYILYGSKIKYGNSFSIKLHGITVGSFFNPK